MDGIKSTYFLLDALDECTDRDEILSFIHDLIDSKKPGLRILATSRREKDIEDGLRPIADHNINIESAVVDEDIRVYVQDRLTRDSKLKKWSAPIQDEIMTVMVEKAGGMYGSLC